MSRCASPRSRRTKATSTPARTPTEVCTPRNSIMFGEPGFVYVYFTYGMHYCMNLVCDGVGTAAAVLLRAGEVVEGVELATLRRGSPPRDLARGPARLTVALGVGRAEYGLDACDPAEPLEVRRGAQPQRKSRCSPARGSDCQRVRRRPGAFGWTASRRSLRIARPSRNAVPPSRPSADVADAQGFGRDAIPPFS